MSCIDEIKYIKNQMISDESLNNHFSKEIAAYVRNFHKTIPGYEETPLTCLEKLAAVCRVKGIYVKDESKRFGQNAFKVLGGSYAIAKYLFKDLVEEGEDLNFEKLTDKKIRQKIGALTFVTATDGNHGKGVAWTADKIRQKCVVYMPKGSSQERLARIRELNAEASILDKNYDDCVRQATEDAKKNGWILLQDTSLEGYEEIPKWIMQGYLTFMDETTQQLGSILPTHVFLQAGVGAMAGSVAGYLASYYKEKKPKIVIVEPQAADCIFQTAKAMDGEIHVVKGDLNTIMAGLACGEPCTLGWEQLRKSAEYFVSIPDEVAAEGMRILAKPLGDDMPIVSGESGAAGFGTAMKLLQDQSFTEIKKEMGINENSIILCISTEGDTDRENYKKIVG